MPTVTISLLNSSMQAQSLFIKNARSQVYLSRNLHKNDTFWLDPGKQVIEIGFRRSMWFSPSSRFLIDVTDPKHHYFDIYEKELCQFIIPILSLNLLLGYNIGLIMLIGRNFNSTLLGLFLIYIPINLYYHIRLLIYTTRHTRLSNGYLELRHGFEY